MLTSHARTLTSRARSITYVLRFAYFFAPVPSDSRSTALQVMASALDRAQLLDYTRAGVWRYLKSATDTCVVRTTGMSLKSGSAAQRRA